jgi:enoyl-CoA hydratase
MTLVELSRADDGVAVITLTNPKVNALSSSLLAELQQIAEDLTDDPPGAVVLTGGRRIFAAGADISEFTGPDAARALGRGFLSALNAVAAIPRITIAAVNGFALGGGCELALACDLRIAGAGAKFGQPEVLLGIIPGGGGTQRLPRLVGPSVAKDLICSGRQVDAAEALRIGLVNEVVDDDAVLDWAVSRAREFAAGALVAQALSKEAIDEGLQVSLHDGLLLEHDLFVESFESDDAMIGVRSFLESGPGKARFTGR